MNVISKSAVKFSMALLLGASALALAGCETSEDRQLASGQACLDSATTSAQADQCVTLVQGLTSPESYLIRCSANFVAQGFTATRIASSIDKVKNTGTQDQMTGMMSFLVFANGTSIADKKAKAQTAVDNCQQSGVRSMLRLATASNMATLIANATTVDPNSTDPAGQMNSAINAFLGGATPADKEALGATAVTASASYCATGSSYETTDVCTILKGAIGNGSKTNAQIAADLIAQLQAK